MNMKRIGAISLALMCLLSVAGCGAGKQEVVREDLMQASQNKAKEILTDKVKRGDLKISQSFFCTAECKNEVECKFGISGLSYESVYVETGDSVKKGELLAELDMTGVEEQIQDSKREYDSAVLALSSLKVQRKDEEEIAKWSYQKAKERKAMEESFEEQERLQKEAIRISGQRLKEAEQEQEKRRIYAPFDGTITYLYDIQGSAKGGANQARSDQKLTFLKIGNGDYVFVGETEYYQNYPVGTKVSMTIGEREYAMQVTKVEDTDSKSKKLTLALLDQSYGISKGAKGTVSAKQKKLENVLYVSNAAILTIQEKNYVYLLSDQGLRTIRQVEVGLCNDNYTEIKSGLEENDSVILN